eukprot:Skav235979  [mRNA]  locus=scaffold592:230574:233068:- [translate_table: standard]
MPTTTPLDMTTVASPVPSPVHSWTSVSPDAKPFCPGMRSEGCARPMAGTEAGSPSWLPLVGGEGPAKQHGFAPTVRYSSSGHLDMKSTCKRSVIRAYRRASLHGYAWYRGQCMTPKDFGLKHPPKPLNRTASGGPAPVMNVHAPKHRLKILQWNPGGLGRERFLTFAHWCAMQHLDVVCLAETRWPFESDWEDETWTYLHSGSSDGQDRGSGLLLMVAKRLCSSSQLAWHSLIPGRLVHFRLFTTPRPLDIIGCYQHVVLPSQIQRTKRADLWHALRKMVSHLPSRHHVVLTGDFNSSLEHRAGHCGPSQYWHGGLLAEGPTHEDQDELLRILLDYDLVSLTTWNAKDGPSYKHDTKSSRIDHVFCRRFQSDAQSKQAGYLSDAPFLPTNGPMHVPLLCTIPKPFIRYGGRPRPQGINMRDGQADAMEFVHRMLEALQIPGVNHAWEKRAPNDPDQLPRVRRVDAGGSHCPLLFQIPEQYAHCDSIAFPSLLDAWCQDWGMLAALTHPSSSLFVHIDRLVQLDGQALSKSAAAITDCWRFRVPIFCAPDNGPVLRCVTFEYILIGALLHFGSPTSGHYQALLRVGPFDPQVPGKWMLTDDNRRMQPVQDWGQRLARAVVMLRFVRADLVSLLDSRSIFASQDPYDAPGLTDI